MADLDAYQAEAFIRCICAYASQRATGCEFTNKRAEMLCGSMSAWSRWLLHLKYALFASDKHVSAESGEDVAYPLLIERIKLAYVRLKFDTYDLAEEEFIRDAAEEVFYVSCANAAIMEIGIDYAKLLSHAKSCGMALGIEYICEFFEKSTKDKLE